MNNENNNKTHLPKLTLNNKINKQAEQKETHRYREHFDSCQMGRGLGKLVRKDEGIKKYKLIVTE